MYPKSNSRGLSAGTAILAIAMVAFVSYLTFAALQGEYGLFRLFQMEAQETQLKAELSALKAERHVVQNKTERLSNGSIDLDLLDEQARKVLGLGRSDEIIIR